MKMYYMDRLYELISAFQKSIRWCEVNDSRYFAQQLMEMGVPGAVLNRLILIAAEDVGLADPSLIIYERRCSDRFENLIKQYGINKKEAVKYPNLCGVVDRGVIAAAVSYKSRLLTMLSFATLFDIYEKEDFSENLDDYLGRFVIAVENRDEKQALYYAYLVGVILDSKDKILTMIQREGGRRNGGLIQKWVDEYKRANELLVLVGSVVLLCRDLRYPHGEYYNAIYQHLSLPIKQAKIPDRAYDRHTRAGKKMGRGFEHFFNEAGTIKNERFSNDWEETGKNAYILANQEGLGKTTKIIKAIKEKL
jgi:hypothetical protein